MIPQHDVFDQVITHIKDLFPDAPEVHPPRWQSIDVSKLPHMSTKELLHFSFGLLLPTERLDFYRTEIQPNLPWADDHFLRERMSGEPLNPGETYKYWPPGMGASGQNANYHLRGGTQFDHSYAERYWPRYAGLTEGGKLNGEDEHKVLVNGHHGIRFRYGDVDDLVKALANEPLTRQAYLPVWFPEDLGAIVDKKARVPCSLGYHFIMRENKLDIVYYLRSCDFVRHFRDDVYMTIRLLLSVLQQCRLENPAEWERVEPGHLIMHITSLHLFKADYKTLFKRGKEIVSNAEPGDMRMKGQS